MIRSLDTTQTSQHRQPPRPVQSTNTLLVHDSLGAVPESVIRIVFGPKSDNVLVNTSVFDLCVAINRVGVVALDAQPRCDDFQRCQYAGMRYERKDEVDGEPEYRNLCESIAVLVIGEGGYKDHQSKALDKYNPGDVKNPGKQKSRSKIERPRSLSFVAGENDAQGSARCKVRKLVWSGDTPELWLESEATQTSKFAPIDDDSERSGQDCQETRKDQYLEIVATRNRIAVMDAASTDPKLKDGEERD